RATARDVHGHARPATRPPERDLARAEGEQGGGEGQQGVLHSRASGPDERATAEPYARWTTSAKWRARRGVAWAICSRQLKPSATINVDSAAERTAGSRTRSPTAIETSYLSFSNPNAPEERLRPAQHAPVVKGAAAAQVARWNADAEPRGAQHGFRGQENLRVEVVVEGVDPQEHLWLIAWPGGGWRLGTEALDAPE